ncbi:MAG TPA: ABC transporter permease [Actinomycetota bacterium]|jgi:spermidine/putrescine transport system permease protein|nr:ABC transporter permease [Actinomycetota bacterium]
MSAVAAPAPEAPVGGIRGYFRNPWRKPRFLQATTLGYLLWSLLPVIIAVIFSFNSGRSRSSWQGFGMTWWTTSPTDSILHDAEIRAAMVQTFKLSFLTVIIAVPLGTLFAIGIDRWHGRPARAANFTMLLSFVVPEIILGVSLYILFTSLFKDIIPLGSNAQLLGLVAYQVSYPVIIVRARLLSIGPEYEEAAMDLGSTPNQAIRRVLLPLLTPAIFASVALVFADTVDDFVTVQALSAGSTSQTLAMKIYSAARASPTPEVNAAATVMLISTLLVIAGGVLFYKRFSKGQELGGATDFAQL